MIKPIHSREGANITIISFPPEQLLRLQEMADPVSKRQNLIERRGEGVPTILTASERLSLRRPLYEQIDHTELKLTIYAASREKNGLLAQFAVEE